MPDLLKAAILGIVQGLTEFLPVSSTGHLVLLEKSLGVSQDKLGLSFDAALHLGTLIAVLVFFWATILRLVIAWLSSIRERRWDVSTDSRLAWLIAIGTVPAGVIGFFFENTIEEKLRQPVTIAVMLVVFGGVLVLAELLGSRKLQATELGAKSALFIGLAQAIALIPGVSRSGITMSAGLFTKLEREQAATFAFLLSAPIVAGAGLKGLYDAIEAARDGLLGREDLAFFAVGLSLAAVTGYFTIGVLLRFLRQHSFYPFAAYRLGLAIVVVAVVIATL
ncbi:MAG TPA: undecaprenyl-diphosphatase UppP [Dehalococcoidia bacterium]|nr:undecaprenyl-diphosphatase UppP [Dehalococcoidia bacterium]